MTALENVIIGAEHPGNAIGSGHAALVERARAALPSSGSKAARRNSSPASRTATSA